MGDRASHLPTSIKTVSFKPQYLFLYTYLSDICLPYPSMFLEPLFSSMLQPIFLSIHIFFVFK